MADKKNPPADETSPSPATPSPTEVDPHFVPADHPDFIPFPDEPKMDASGPTDRDAPDLGEPTEEDEDGDTSDQTDDQPAEEVKSDADSQ